MARRRRLLVSMVAFGALAACSAAAADDPATQESQDAISISNLYKLVRGNIDRSKVDPANPWAQTKLGIGEEYRLPGEDAEFAAMAKQVNEFQTRAKKDSGASKIQRAFHVKSHACNLGSLRIDPSALPAEAKIGLFAEAATYPTWVRFSNGVGSKQSDRKVDLRAFSMKIMGVRGNRLVTSPGDETATTQDFLLSNHDVGPAADARHFMAFGAAMIGSDDSGTILGKFDNMVQAGAFLTSDENVRTVDFLANLALPKTKELGSLLADSYSTGAANALGIEAGDPNTARAKGAFKVVVKTGILSGGRCTPVNTAPKSSDEDFLRTDLVKRFASDAVCADVFVQLQENAATEPIEDVSVPWRTKLISVGRITFEKGNLESPALTADRARCEDFSFRPWHTIDVHRPLGNIMRSRRVVLPASATFRDAERKEPTP